MLIFHRDSTGRLNNNLKNKLNYILNTISLSFHVEIDIW